MLKRRIYPDGATQMALDATLSGTDEPTDDRAKRARNEPMLVVPETDPGGECIGLYAVSTGSASTYTVDLTDGRCDCPDMQHNQPEGGCKHWRRVALAVEETSLPAPGEVADGYNAALDDMRDAALSELAEVNVRAATLRYFVEEIDGVLGDAE